MNKFMSLDKVEQRLNWPLETKVLISSDVCNSCQILRSDSRLEYCLCGRSLIYQSSKNYYPTITQTSILSWLILWPRVHGDTLFGVSG